MIKLSACAVLLVMVSLLTSCLHRMPPAVTACRASCIQRAQVCTKVCHNNCKQCTVRGCRSARGHYNKYRHEICIKGGIIARHINSYRDPLQCRKVTCDCRADFNICMQSCHGAIRKRLQAPPIC